MRFVSRCSSSAGMIVQAGQILFFVNESKLGRDRVAAILVWSGYSGFCLGGRLAFKSQHLAFGRDGMPVRLSGSFDSGKKDAKSLLEIAFR